jgi:hypothetical protein
MADFACSDVGIDRKSCVATHRSSKRKEEREPTGTLANVGHGLRDLGVPKMRRVLISRVLQTTWCVDVPAHYCHPPPERARRSVFAHG